MLEFLVAMCHRKMNREENEAIEEASSKFVFVQSLVSKYSRSTTITLRSKQF